MKNIINTEQYGEIVYDENFWTGKKQLSVNGVPLTKTGKNSFQYTADQNVIPVTITGSMLFGAKVNIGGTVIYQLTSAPRWYEYIFPILTFLINLIWGNCVPLVKIVPLVGGAIGGAISGIFAVLAFFLSRQVKKPLYKLLIGAGMLVACFGVCALIGFSIVNSLS